MAEDFEKMNIEELRKYVKDSNEASAYITYPQFRAGGSINEFEEKEEFWKMIKQLVKNDDEKLKNALWNMRKELLQQRMKYVIELYDDKERHVGTLIAYKYWYTHGQKIADYFEGQIVSSLYQDFQTIVNKFTEIMRSEGCGGIGFSTSIGGNEKVKIKRMTFALHIV